MKNELLFLLAQQFGKNTNLKSKLKKVLIVGSIFSILGLVVVGTIGYYVVNQVISLASSPQAQAAGSKALAEVTRLQGNVTSPSCLTQLKSMLNFDTWLNTPLANNAAVIQQVCLNARAKIEQENQAPQEIKADLQNV
ncbi:hypothetical protein JNK13_04220 [bacterium]|nr:hypothetical protein [bacterium]